LDPIGEGEVTLLAGEYAKVARSLGVRQGEPLLILPNGDFFPDRFRGDQGSIEALVARLTGYAGLDVAVGARLVGAEAEGCGDGSCGTGGCGTGAALPSDARMRTLRQDGEWTIEVPAQELGDPIVLTARLASALAAITWLESGEVDEVSAQHAEVAAVTLGFGVLLLEASYLYRKSCGGPSVGRATALDCRSLSVLFSLFLAREGLTPRAARAELGATQQALLDSAWLLVDESPTLVGALKNDLDRVAAGRFPLRDGGSWLGRLFGKRKAASREDEALAALERGASVDELAALLGSGESRR
jgi:hypothetical protein